MNHASLQLDRPRRRPRIGLTPLIDVVFILLLFFMLSSTFEDQRRIELEAPGAASAVTSTDVLVLELGLEGYVIDGDSVTTRQARMRIASFDAAHADGGVVIRVGGGVQLAGMVEAVDLVRAAGVDRFSLQPAEDR